MSRLGIGGSGPAPSGRVVVRRYVCPACQGEPAAVGCFYCSREGVITAEQAEGWPADDLVELDRPAGVRRKPCGDCAYRPGSPEEEGHRPPPADPSVVFFCHVGMPLIEGTYTPQIVTGDGVPVGALVCSGWWDSVVCGQAAPERPYREPLAGG